MNSLPAEKSDDLKVKDRLIPKLFNKWKDKILQGEKIKKYKTTAECFEDNKIEEFIKNEGKWKEEKEWPTTKSQKKPVIEWLLKEKHNGLGSHGGNYIDLDENTDKLIVCLNDILNHKKNNQKTGGEFNSSGAGYKLETTEELKKKKVNKRQKNLEEWGFVTKSGRNLQIVYNRVFCAFYPDDICTIPDNTAVEEVLKSLNKLDPDSLEKDSLGILNEVFVKQNKTDEVAIKFKNEKNWLDKNNAIVKILDIELKALKSELEESKKIENEDFRYFRNAFAWHLYTYFTSDFTFSKQIIKYGAPGTGKTYLTRIEAEEFFQSWKWEVDSNEQFDFKDHFETVQFHPSFTYEDFMEGIRPVSIKDGHTQLKLTDGVFKTFCKKAAKWEIELYKLGLGRNSEGENIFDSVTVSQVKKKLEEKEAEMEAEKELEKEAEMEKDNYLHLKELIKEKTDEELIKDLIPPYFFVIDEINRAELSRVFGELMYCLEYRGYPGKVKTQYSELAEGETIFFKENNGNNGNFFFIPHNVYIIGTMNTIDRSVESFDFALRRRFLWQELEPNEEVLTEYFSEKSNFDKGVTEILIEPWKQLNDQIKIQPLLGKDYRIGHSYLMKLHQYEDLTLKEYKKKIWNNHIEPILQEYFRGMGSEQSSLLKGLNNTFFLNKDNQNEDGKNIEKT